MILEMLKCHIIESRYTAYIPVSDSEADIRLSLPGILSPHEQAAKDNKTKY